MYTVAQIPVNNADCTCCSHADAKNCAESGLAIVRQPNQAKRRRTTNSVCGTFGISTILNPIQSLQRQRFLSPRYSNGRAQNRSQSEQWSKAIFALLFKLMSSQAVVHGDQYFDPVGHIQEIGEEPQQIIDC
ncbi:hypothetical protein JOM56_003083 [Amanita muscaria]